MKKLTMVCAMIALAATASFADIKVEGLAWADYDSAISTNGSYTGSQWNISRFYVTLQGDVGKDPFGNSIKGRLTMDLAKAQFSSASTKSIPIKMAYFDYNVNFNKFYPVTDATGAVFTNTDMFAQLTFSAGLVKSFFGYIADWGYVMPMKDATEMYSSVKPSASADLGTMISAKIGCYSNNTDGIVKFNLQMLNGDGYEKIFSATSTDGLGLFAYQASAYFMPVIGAGIGGSFRLDNTASNKTITSFDIVAYAKNLVLNPDDPIASATPIPVDFLFQYINQSAATFSGTNTNVVNGTVLSAMLGYGLLPDANGIPTVTPYIRYDRLDPTTNTNDESSYLYVSANIVPTKNLAIRPMFGYTLSGAKAGDIQMKLEFETKISFSVWQ